MLAYLEKLAVLFRLKLMRSDVLKSPSKHLKMSSVGTNIAK